MLLGIIFLNTELYKPQLLRDEIFFMHCSLQIRQNMYSIGIFRAPLVTQSINKYILEEWQTSWNNSIGNKLLDIKPTIGEYQSVVRNIRREEVVLARLCLGHTRVTHSYLLQGEEQPQCVGYHSLYVTSFWNVATLHQ